MSIAEKIHVVLSRTLPDWDIVFDDWRGVDKLLTKSTLPCVFVILPNGGRIEYRNGRMRHAQDIAMAFAVKVPKDANGADNDLRTEYCLNTAEMFLQAIANSGYFLPFGVVNYTTFYEQTSSIVSGVVLNLTLEDEAKCI